MVRLPKIHRRKCPKVPFEGEIIGWVEKKLPADSDYILGSIAEEAQSELWKIYGRIEDWYKPNRHGRNRSLESCFFLYARYKLLRYFWKRYHERKQLLFDLATLADACEKDDEEGITRHKHLKLHPFYDERKQIGRLLEENEAREILRCLAKKHGLEEVLKMTIEGYTQREIAEKTKMTRDNVAKRMERLVREANKFFSK